MTTCSLTDRLEAALAAKTVLFERALDVAVQLQPTCENDVDTTSLLEKIFVLLEDVRRIDENIAPYVEQWHRQGMRSNVSMTAKLAHLAEVIGRLRDCVDLTGRGVQGCIRELGPVLDDANRSAQMRRAYQSVR